VFAKAINKGQEGSSRGAPTAMLVIIIAQDDVASWFDQRGKLRAPAELDCPPMPGPLPFEKP
jgi:hypothetical protein